MKLGHAGRIVVAMIATGSFTGVSAAPLKVVEVATPNVNCIYQSNCAIIATDSTGDIPVPGFTQGGFLQSRTFAGVPGAPAAGKNGYQYRISMMQAAAGAAPCVTTLKIDFGPILKFRYKADDPPADVYVVTSGGLGTIGLASADQTGAHITFVMARPVCVGATFDRSESSYFIGLTAAGMPKPATAQMLLTGGSLLTLPVRTPAH